MLKFHSTLNRLYKRCKIQFLHVKKFIPILLYFYLDIDIFIFIYIHLKFIGTFTFLSFYVKYKFYIVNYIFKICIIFMFCKNEKLYSIFRISTLCKQRSVCPWNFMVGWIPINKELLCFIYLFCKMFVKVYSKIVWNIWKKLWTRIFQKFNHSHMIVL